jgi:hypothetical protein
MFGISKKKAPEGSFIIVAVQAASILRNTEIQNGGLYSTPQAIKATVKSVANQMSVELNGNLAEATQTCVMELLMEQKFIDKLLLRARNGPIGTLTIQDEDDIARIVEHIFKR